MLKAPVIPLKKKKKKKKWITQILRVYLIWGSCSSSGRTVHFVEKKGEKILKK